MMIQATSPVIPSSLAPNPNKGKEGTLVRPLSQSGSIETSSKCKLDGEIPEEVDDTSLRYIHLLSNEERTLGNVNEDHGYSKPYNWRPEYSLTRPTKTLFVPRVPRQHFLLPPKDSDIDVTSIDEASPLPGRYDDKKARFYMNETVRYTGFGNPRLYVSNEKEENDWDEKSVPKEGWTQAQSRLFNKAMKILHADRLYRLAADGSRNEPVLRRLSADKTAKRFRLALAGITWNTKLTRWLHDTLTDCLPKHYMAAYLEVLQSLRSKMPVLIDKMVSGKVPMDISNQLSKDGVHLLIKRPWDPVADSLREADIKKLPKNPLLILVCMESWTRRSKRWASMLSQLGKLVVLDYSSEDSRKMSISSFLHHMITQTIAKIRDLKRLNPDRPVILLGWGSVSSVACQVAAMETIAVVVCLGFPMFTLDGTRGEPDDPIMDLKTAIIFLIGQNSSLCRTDDIEDMRSRMKAETALVILGEADDQLRISKNKKRLEGISQSMVDRCLIDEIREFVSHVLRAAPPSPQNTNGSFVIPNFSVVDSGSLSPLIPANPVFAGVGTPSSNPSSKKGTARPRKKSDKPKKPKNSSSVPISMPLPTTLPTQPLGIPKPLQTTMKIPPPTILPPLFLSQSPSKTISGEDFIKAQKLLEMKEDKKPLIELPSTPLKPSEALGIMSNTPNLMTASPLLPSSSLTVPSSTTVNSATVTAKHIISNLPTVRAPGIKQVMNFPQLVSPSAVISSGKILSPSLSNMILLNQADLNKATVKQPISIKSSTSISSGGGITITHAGGSSQTLSASTTTAEPMTIRKITTMPGTTLKKENLYIVAVPSGDASKQDARFPANQTLAFVTDPTTRPEQTGTKDKDRRNVAEILASLSGLQPEPSVVPSSALTITTFKGTSSQSFTQNKTNIVTTTAGSSRIVRVIQTIGDTKNIQAQLAGTSSAPQAQLAIASSAVRPRKQMFVTNDIKCISESTPGPSEMDTALNVDEDTLSSPSPKTSLSFEHDILEEDLDDLEYKPYAKKSKGSAKAKKSN